MANTFRFPSAPNQDNTYRTATFETKNVDFATSITIKPTQYHTIVNIGTMTDNTTINAYAGDTNVAPYIGDKLELYFANASGSNKTVVLGTGFHWENNLTVVNGSVGMIHATFNGSTWVCTSMVSPNND